MESTASKGRKSKSLEESKGLYLDHGAASSSYSAYTDPLQRSESHLAVDYQPDDFSRQYRTLTICNQERHEGVETFVRSLRSLEERGLLKHVGSDKNGFPHYLLFGLNYPRDNDDGQIEAINNEIIEVIKYEALR